MAVWYVSLRSSVAVFFLCKKMDYKYHHTFYYCFVALTIVGNKIDRKDEVVVSMEKGKVLAASHNAAFVESSAAEDIGKGTVNIVATF